MASVLSLPIQLETAIYAQSWTSCSDNASVGTVQRLVTRSTSPMSTISASSLPLLQLSRYGENEASKLGPRPFLDVAARDPSKPERRRASLQVPDRSEWPSPVTIRTNTLTQPTPFVTQVVPRKASTPPKPSIPIIRMPDESDEDYGQLQPGFGNEEEAIIPGVSPLSEGRLTNEKQAEQSLPQAQATSHWWMTRRKRKFHQKPNAFSAQDESQETEEQQLAEEPISPLRTPDQRANFHSGHRKSLSLSSSVLQNVVKSASMTIASVSVAHTSRKRALSGFSSRDGSDFDDLRNSFDSTAPSIGANIDAKALERSVQRRQVLKEVVTTEENYLNDMKALYNSFCNAVLVRLPHDRRLIQKAIDSIVQLHEELLGDLKQAIPRADNISEEHNHHTMTMKKHLRLRSADSAPVKAIAAGFAGLYIRASMDNCQTSIEQKKALSADPRTVMDVVKVFDKYMRRFLAYEAYAALRNALDHDTAAISKFVEKTPLKDWSYPTFATFEKGGEGWERRVMTPAHQLRDGEKKALTFSDLLAKPIQRICKYPLFFKELCKQTPACDDPVTHDELQKIVFRLEETILEINQAKDNPSTRRLIETTWRLQDRFQFEGDHELPKSMMLHLIGHVQLCGVLHVAYETTEQIAGQYMLCVLYRSCMVLAKPNKSFSAYTVAAVISLLDAATEEADNGKGLQCHTAPFTWKLIFEYCNREYEVLLSACSEKEEDEWRTRIRSRIDAEAREFGDRKTCTVQAFTLLQLKLRPLGLVPGSLALSRRESIQRAATVGPKSNLRQVIIRNTATQKDARSNKDMDTPMWRSQSHLSSHNIPTLAPRRAERSRMENALSDVWSKEVLPYPGIGSRPMQNIRASATTVMRKMSMASISSNFSKRSASLVSNGSQLTDDTRLSIQKSLGPAQSRPSNRPSSAEKRRNPKPVDFHNAPEQFLPEDFELKKESEAKRRMFFPRTGLASQPSTPRSLTPTRPESRKSSHHRHPGVENVSPSRTPTRLGLSTGMTSPREMGKSTAANSSSPSQQQSAASLQGQTKRPFKTKSRLFTDIKRALGRPFSPQPT